MFDGLVGNTPASIIMYLGDPLHVKIILILPFPDLEKAGRSIRLCSVIPVRVNPVYTFSMALKESIECKV